MFSKVFLRQTQQTICIPPHLKRVASLPCEIFGALLNHRCATVYTIYRLKEMNVLTHYYTCI